VPRQEGSCGPAGGEDFKKSKDWGQKNKGRNHSPLHWSTPLIVVGGRKKKSEEDFRENGTGEWTRARNYV